MFHIIDERTGGLGHSLPSYRQADAQATADQLNAAHPQPLFVVVEGGWDVGTTPWARKWVEARRA